VIPNLCLADNRDHLLQTIANTVKGAKAWLLPSQNPNQMFDTERRILAVSVLFLSLSALAATF